MITDIPVGNICIGYLSKYYAEAVESDFQKNIIGWFGRSTWIWAVKSRNASKRNIIDSEKQNVMDPQITGKEMWLAKTKEKRNGWAIPARNRWLNPSTSDEYQSEKSPKEQTELFHINSKFIWWLNVKKKSWLNHFTNEKDVEMEDKLLYQNIVL